MYVRKVNFICGLKTVTSEMQQMRLRGRNSKKLSRPKCFRLTWDVSWEHFSMSFYSFKRLITECIKSRSLQYTNRLFWALLNFVHWPLSEGAVIKMALLVRAKMTGAWFSKFSGAKVTRADFLHCYPQKWVLVEFWLKKGVDETWEVFSMLSSGPPKRWVLDEFWLKKEQVELKKTFPILSSDPPERWVLDEFWLKKIGRTLKRISNGTSPKKVGFRRILTKKD